MATSPRILYYDLETSLQPVAVFGLANNDWIAPENLLSERYIISAAWLWAGEKTVHSVSVLDDQKRYKKNPHDDKHVVETMHEILSQADCVVTHNGDHFDNKYLATRALIHGLSVLPPITSIDTYKTAKSRLYLNSNKLDYIGKILGVGQKIKTSPGLWLRVLNGDASAVREMVTYNKQDVLLLEKVFHKLQPYVQNHINRELFGGLGCPRCGSSKVQSRGVHHAISRTYRRFQCQACSGWFRAMASEKGSSTQYRVL